MRAPLSPGKLSWVDPLVKPPTTKPQVPLFRVTIVRAFVRLGGVLPDMIPETTGAINRLCLMGWGIQTLH